MTMPTRRPLIRIRRTRDALGARVTYVQVRLPLLYGYIRSWRSADGRVGNLRFGPPLRHTPQATPIGQAPRVSRISTVLMLVVVAASLFRWINGDSALLVASGVLVLIVIGSIALERGWRPRMRRPA